MSRVLEAEWWSKISPMDLIAVSWLWQELAHTLVIISNENLMEKVK